MFNRLKQEIIIMKKYIAPICEKFEVLPESAIMSLSLQEGLSGPENQLSNERESVSGSIWDQEY